MCWGVRNAQVVKKAVGSTTTHILPKRYGSLPELNSLAASAPSTYIRHWGQPGAGGVRRVELGVNLKPGWPSEACPRRWMWSTLRRCVWRLSGMATNRVRAVEELGA